MCWLTQPVELRGFSKKLKGCYGNLPRWENKMYLKMIGSCMILHLKSRMEIYGLIYS